MANTFRQPPSHSVAFVKLFSSKKQEVLVISSDSETEEQMMEEQCDILAQIEKMERKISSAEEVIAWCLRRLSTDNARIRTKLKLWETRVSFLKDKRGCLQEEVLKMGVS